VEGVDQLPLAIELAAGRTHLMTLKQIREGLAYQQRLLRSARRDRKERHRSMWHAVRWSWELLDGWEQDTLVQCSLFRGGFSLEAAEEVVDLDEHPDGGWVIDSISTLFDKSLLSKSPTSSLPRFSMFETIRQFVLEEQGLKAGFHAGQQRHAQYYARYGERGFVEALDRKGGVALRRELVAERKNLAHALEFALETGAGNLGLTLCLAMMEILNMQGPVSAAIEWSDRALALSDLDPELRCRVLAHRGISLRLGGKLEESERVMAGLLEFARAEKQREPEVVALGSLGVVALEFDRREEAGQFFAEALVLATELGYKRHQAIWLSNTSVLLRRMGKIDEAVDCYQQALALCREQGLRRGEGILLGEMGNLDRELGRLDQAIDKVKDSLAIHREVGDRHYESIGENDLGIYLLAAKRFEESREHLEAARVLAAQIGNRKIEAIASGNLGDLLLETDQLDEAQVAFTSAVEIAQEIGARAPVVMFRASIGELARRQGNLDEAHRLLAEAEIEMRALNYPAALVELLLYRGRAHMDSGSIEAAKGVVEEMRAIAAEMGPSLAPQVMPQVEELVAAIANSTGDEKS
jgi:tetratricopeptide (TPR) repeat protein